LREWYNVGVQRILTLALYPADSKHDPRTGVRQ